MFTVKKPMPQSHRPSGVGSIIPRTHHTHLGWCEHTMAKFAQLWGSCPRGRFSTLILPAQLCMPSSVGDLNAGTGYRQQCGLRKGHTDSPCHWVPLSRIFTKSYENKSLFYQSWSSDFCFLICRDSWRCCILLAKPLRKSIILFHEQTLD